MPGGSLRGALLKTAGSFFRRSGRLQELETAFYRRDLLPVGEIVGGPAIVLQTDTTTVVPPDSTIVADGSGNLIIRLRGGK
jgi:N-methylhydantoinase A